MKSDALADFDQVEAREARWGRSILLEWRSPAAFAHYELGDRARALSLTHEDLAISDAWGAPRRRGMARAMLGVIEGGERGIEYLEAALPLLEQSGARLEHARAQINLGAALRRAGRPSEARAPLRAGLNQAMQCGGRALIGLAHDELAATGVRRFRRTMLSGNDALTPRERRIAEMAAQGLSNPAIARALFITRKTVEMHLGNAYRKLGINSRHEIAGALGAGATSSEHAAMC